MLRGGSEAAAWGTGMGAGQGVRLRLGAAERRSPRSPLPRLRLRRQPDLEPLGHFSLPAGEGPCVGCQAGDAGTGVAQLGGRADGVGRCWTEGPSVRGGGGGWGSGGGQNRRPAGG